MPKHSFSVCTLCICRGTGSLAFLSFQAASLATISYQDASYLSGKRHFPFYLICFPRSIYLHRSFIYFGHWISDSQSLWVHPKESKPLVYITCFPCFFSLNSAGADEFDVFTWPNKRDNIVMDAFSHLLNVIFEDVFFSHSRGFQKEKVEVFHNPAKEKSHSIVHAWFFFS